MLREKWESFKKLMHWLCVGFVGILFALCGVGIITLILGVTGIGIIVTLLFIMIISAYIAGKMDKEIGL